MATEAQYTVVFSQIDEQLTPPMLRNPIYVSWINALHTPVQYLHNEIFQNGYLDGATASNYSNSATYTPTNLVVYTDRAVWINAATCSGITPSIANPTYWTQYNDNYIGANERLKYNSQKILFQYALNRWFQCSGIWIHNNIVSPNPTPFVMGQTSQYSSYMGNSSTLTKYYMGNSPFFPNPTTNDFTINVPITVANALTNETPDVAPNISAKRQAIIKSFADQYVIAGILYNIVTFNPYIPPFIVSTL